MSLWIHEAALKTGFHFNLHLIGAACIKNEEHCALGKQKVAKQILVLGIIINILHIHFMYRYVNICLCSSFDYMCFLDVCLFRVTLTSVSSIYIHQFQVKNRHLKLSTTDRWYLLPCHHTQIAEFLNLCCLHWRKVGVKTSPWSNSSNQVFAEWVCYWWLVSYITLS